MPVLPYMALAEAETLNKILKDYLFYLEKSIIRDFKAKAYARNRVACCGMLLLSQVRHLATGSTLDRLVADVSVLGKTLAHSSPLSCL